MHFHRLSWRTVALTIASGTLLSGAPVRANSVSVQFSLAGLPAATGLIQAIDLTGEVASASLIAGLPNDSVSVTVDTSTNQGIVQASSPGLYAAPVSGGSLGSPTYWSAPYFSTGVGTITLVFSAPQTYFGLLWGSVDSGATSNTVTFANVVDGTVTPVATIDGDDIITATGSTSADGFQGYGGSYYVLLNDTIGTFNEIILGGTQVSFEFRRFRVCGQPGVAPRSGASRYRPVRTRGCRPSSSATDKNGRRVTKLSGRDAKRPSTSKSPALQGLDRYGLATGRPGWGYAARLYITDHEFYPNRRFCAG